MDIRENRLASSTNYVIRTRQYASSRGETDVCQQKQDTRETRRPIDRTGPLENPLHFSEVVRTRVNDTPRGKSIRRVSCSPLKACNRHNNKRSLALPVPHTNAYYYYTLFTPRNISDTSTVITNCTMERNISLSYSFVPTRTVYDETT